MNEIILNKLFISYACMHAFTPLAESKTEENTFDQEQEEEDEEDEDLLLFPEEFEDEEW